jgi:hypothetical protein
MSVVKRVDKKTLLFWAAIFSLAICLIYALFNLASSLGLQYFVLSNRGMAQQTISGSILSGSLDIAVWGFAIFVVLAWLSCNIVLKNVSSNYLSFSTVGKLLIPCAMAVALSLVVLNFFGIWFLVLISSVLLGLCFMFAPDLFGVGRKVLFLRVLFGGLLLVFFIELAGLFLFNIPVALGLKTGGLASHWGWVEQDFANLGYPFLPFVYLFFVLFGLVAYVFRVLPSGWLWLIAKVKARRFVDRLNGFFEFGESWSFGFRFLSSRLIIVLAVVVSSVVSCLFVVFTVLPWSNPTGMMVSVDSPVYYNLISQMRSVDVNSALSLAFGNHRALFLVLCYALSFVAPIVSVIQFSAALLLVMLSVVSVFVLRLLTKSRKVLVLGVLLVPFSFDGLGLIYSGYFANMLALIIIFVYVVLFFKLLDKWSSSSFFALLSVSVLVLFSHSWTWFMFALSLGMFLLLEWRLAVRDRCLWGRFKDKAILIIATISVGLMVDMLRSVLSPISSSGSVLNTAKNSLGFFLNPAYLVTGMKNAVDFTLGGVFANQLFVAIAFVGFLVLLRFKSEVSNFFVAWVFVVCVSVLFATGDLVFNRALFMLPWVVLSGLGLAFVIKFAGSTVGQIGILKGRRLWVVLLVLGFVFVVLLNYALRYLFNINIW